MKKKYIIAAFAAVAALGVTSVAQSTLKGSERSDGHTVTSQKDAIRAAAERDTNPAVVEDLAAEREAAGETARRRVGVAQNDSTRVNGFNTSNLKVTASVPIPQPAPVDPCEIRPELCEDREDDAGGGGGGGGGECGYCTGFRQIAYVTPGIFNYIDVPDAHLPTSSGAMAGRSYDGYDEGDCGRFGHVYHEANYTANVTFYNSNQSAQTCGVVIARCERGNVWKVVHHDNTWGACNQHGGS